MYFRIVIRSLRDSIPKAIGHFLVNSSTESLQTNVQIDITARSGVLDCMNESKDVAEERNKLMKWIDVLTKSMNSIKREPTLKEYLKE